MTAPAQVVDQLRDALPLRAAAPVTRVALYTADGQPYDPRSGERPVMVTLRDAELVRAIGVRDDAVAALDAGKALVLAARDAGAVQASPWRRRLKRLQRSLVTP